MFLTDDHLHTKFSLDGCEEPEAVCESAIAHCLSEITLTDHLDLFSDQAYSATLDCPAWYRRMKETQEKYRGHLQVHIGIELGQPQVNIPESKAFLEKYPLDFIIGSVHCMEGDIDVYDYDFSKVDEHILFPHYIEWLLALAQNSDFDVMGHVTYPARYMLERRGIHVDMMQFEEAYRALFTRLVQNSRGIELNMSGPARGGGMPMPEHDLLKLYKACGGEIITIGSDAHFAVQAGSVSKAGQELLAEAGFKYVTYFEERKPKFIKI